MAKWRKYEFIRSILERFLNKEEVKWKVLKYRIMNEWKNITGPAIYGHTAPYDYRKAVLYIYVDSPAWMNELNMRKMDIIMKYRRVLRGDYIKDIYFKAGRIRHIFDQEIRSDDSRIDLSSITIDKGKKLPENFVKDEKLHDEFDKLMEQYYRRVTYDETHSETGSNEDNQTALRENKEKKKAPGLNYGLRTDFFSNDEDF